MTSTLLPFAYLSDRAVLAQLESAVDLECQASAHVVALLMEVDARKLYAAQSCSSLFTFCVEVLHFSEHAAYLRIEAARAARRCPLILERLASASVHLTAVSLLAPHLTEENHIELLDAAHHKSKRQVEQLVVRLRPKPDVPTVIRKLPTPNQVEAPVTAISAHDPVVEQRTAPADVVVPGNVAARRTRPATMAPLAPDRFKVQLTVSRETYDKLRRVQDLMRHTIPDGDPATIFDRALTLLLNAALKEKCADVKDPRPSHAAKRGSRHIPAAVRREVWHRDGGQCAFRGERGRCTETGFLEFHHIVPFARGGATTSQNLELRCRQHNVYEAEQQFGRDQPWLMRETRADWAV